jgi:hypothetical protein
MPKSSRKSQNLEMVGDDFVKIGPDSSRVKSEYTNNKSKGSQMV